VVRAAQRAPQLLRIGADPVRRLREGITDRFRDLLARRVASQLVAVLGQLLHDLLQARLRLLRLTARALSLRRVRERLRLPERDDELAAERAERARGPRLGAERGEPAGERGEGRPDRRRGAAARRRRHEREDRAARRGPLGVARCVKAGGEAAAAAVGGWGTVAAERRGPGRAVEEEGAVRVGRQEGVGGKEAPLPPAPCPAPPEP